MQINNNDDNLFAEAFMVGRTFDLIEFSLRRTLPNGTSAMGQYGINVAKVREVIRLPQINALSAKIPGIAGVFELRGVPITAINLAAALGDENAIISKEQKVIIAEFSNKRAGFIVDQTKRIISLPWDKVLPPASDESSCISGMILQENKDFMFILDLEKIVAKFENANARAIQAQMPMPVFTGPVGHYGGPGYAPNFGPQTRSNRGPLKRILLVDDSQMVRANVSSQLQKHGFDVILANNGLDAMEILSNVDQNPDYQDIKVVITDIEMPKMDGISLCQWVKQHHELSQIPVIIHSSLSNSASQTHGMKAGALAYVVKNDFNDLLKTLKKCG